MAAPWRRTRGGGKLSSAEVPPKHLLSASPRAEASVSAAAVVRSASAAPEAA